MSVNSFLILPCLTPKNLSAQNSEFVTRNLVLMSRCYKFVVFLMSTYVIDLYFFKLLCFFFFLIWTIFKVFVEFVTILLLFCILVFFGCKHVESKLCNQGLSLYSLHWKVKSELLAHRGVPAVVLFQSAGYLKAVSELESLFYATELHLLHRLLGETP